MPDGETVPATDEDPEFRESLIATVLVGRTAGPASCGALLMLASSASDSMTGQTLVIDERCTAA